MSKMQVDCKVKFSTAGATITPALATCAGRQGENNATLINFNISGLDIAAGVITKYHVDVVDGAGGIHNSAVMELDNTKAYTSLDVSYNVPVEVTEPGGRAEVTLVISTFTEGTENYTLQTPPLVLMFSDMRSVGTFGQGQAQRKINAAVLQAEELLADTQAAADTAAISEENAKNCAAEAAEHKTYAAESAETATQKAELAERAKGLAEEAQQKSEVAKGLAEEAQSAAEKSERNAADYAKTAETCASTATEAAMSATQGAVNAGSYAHLAENSANYTSQYYVEARNAAEEAARSAERLATISDEELIIYPTIYNNDAPDWTEHDASNVDPYILGKDLYFKADIRQGKTYLLQVQMETQNAVVGPLIMLLKKQGEDIETISEYKFSSYNEALGYYQLETTVQCSADKGEEIIMFVGYPDTEMDKDYSALFGGVRIRLKESLRGVIDSQNEEIAQIGDIETALDGIIAIQNELIGGGNQ